MFADVFLFAEVLVLDDNSIEGQIPTSTGNVTSLFLIRISGNKLGGTIPTEIGLLRRLFELDLSNNRLGGTLPTELGSLDQLQELHLSSNFFSGNIPNTTAQLSELTELDLDNNELTGTVPTSIARLGSLDRLYFAFNELSGVLPTELGTLSMLTELTLDENNFDGSFPEGLCKLKLRLLLADCNLGCTCCNTKCQVHNNVTSLPNSPSKPPRDGNDVPSKGHGMGNIDDVFADISPASSFKNAQSPQSMALKWIKDDASYSKIANASSESVDNLSYQGRPLDIAVIQRYALAAFYFSAGGRPWPGAGGGWKDTTNWLSDAGLCAWVGVTCNSNNKIIRLELPNNKLDGTIAAEIKAILSLGKENCFGNSKSFHKMHGRGSCLTCLHSANSSAVFVPL